MDTLDALRMLLCARILARMRVQEVSAPPPPISWEEMLTAEGRLGFTLPPILRMLYTQVANGGALLGDEWNAIASLPSQSTDRPPQLPETTLEPPRQTTGWRLPTAVVTALQQRPGSFVSCYLSSAPEEDNWNYELPEGLTYLEYEGCDVTIMLDTQTGCLYINDDGRLSFCSASIEEWLAQSLDGDMDIQVRRYPGWSDGTQLCTVHDLKSAWRSGEKFVQPIVYDGEPLEPLLSPEYFWQRNIEIMENSFASLKPDERIVFPRIGPWRPPPDEARQMVSQHQHIQLNRQRLQLVRHIYEGAVALAEEALDEAWTSPAMLPPVLQEQIDAEAKLYRLVSAMGEYDPKSDALGAIPF